jgi:hypothetical protein
MIDLALDRAGAEVRCGSDSENLRLSITSPLHPQKADMERTLAEVRVGPIPAVSSRSKILITDHLVGERDQRQRHEGQ